MQKKAEQHSACPWERGSLRAHDAAQCKPARVPPCPLALYTSSTTATSHLLQQARLHGRWEAAQRAQQCRRAQAPPALRSATAAPSAARSKRCTRRHHYTPPLHSALHAHAHRGVYGPARPHRPAGIRTRPRVGGSTPRALPRHELLAAGSRRAGAGAHEHEAERGTALRGRGRGWQRVRGAAHLGGDLRH
jgi:hypothetical protein